MQATAGAGSLRAHVRPLAHSAWSLPAVQRPFCRILESRRSISQCPLVQAQWQHSSNCNAVSTLTLPLRAAHLRMQRQPLSTCAARRSGGVPEAVERQLTDRRVPRDAADPRDGDERSSSMRQQKHPKLPTAASREILSEEALAEDGFLDDNDGTDEGELVAGDIEDEEETGLDGEGEYGDGYDEDEDEDEGEGDDYATSFLEPDDAPRELATGGTSWGEVVLKAARSVLEQPSMKGLELYLFRTLPASRKVDIRLDKLDDLYGSPSIDDIERFQRGLFAALDREMGPEAAGEISFEVSSPGAERLVQVPDELTRFAELPLRVEHRTAEGKDTSSVLLLAGLDEAAGVSSWRLANVRANATVKGRALSKRQLAQVITIPVTEISKVRIHVDF